METDFDITLFYKCFHIYLMVLTKGRDTAVKPYERGHLFKCLSGLSNASSKDPFVYFCVLCLISILTDELLQCCLSKDSECQCQP